MDVLCLQETKCNEASIRVIALFLNFSHFCCVETNGRSGGLGMFWNDPLRFDVIDVSHHWIHGTLSSCYSKCLITCIYGPPKRHKRFKLWDFVESIGNPQIPWLLIRDFNQVLSVSDKSSSCSKIWGATRPLNLINNMGSLKFLVWAISTHG